MLKQPSRLALNLGILTGGLIGLLLSLSRGSDDSEAFLITGLCAIIGAGVFSYIEVFLLRRNR